MWGPGSDTGGAHGGGGGGRVQEELLLETRRLLSALNEENRELKSENAKLVEQAQAAAEFLRRVRSDKETLERDLKLINFNLMQQLRLKVSAIEEVEAKCKRLEEQLQEAERHRSTATMAQSEAGTENTLLRERIQSLEKQLSHATERAARSEEETAQCAQKLNEAIAAHRDRQRLASEQQRAALADVEARLRQRDEEARGLGRVVEELRFELGHLRSSLAERDAGTRADYKRAVAAQTEALQAREELIAVMVSARDSLDAMRARVQEVVSEGGELSTWAVEAMQDRQQAMSRHVEAYNAANDGIIDFVLSKLLTKERQLDGAREKIASDHVTMVDVERVLAQAHERIREQRDHAARSATQISELRTALDHRDGVIGDLSRRIEGLEVDLQRARQHAAAAERERDGAATDQEARMAALQRQLVAAEAEIKAQTQYRMQSEERLQRATRQRQKEAARLGHVQAAYEEEVAELQGDILECSQLLAAALSKVSAAHSRSRSRRSHARSPSSGDAAWAVSPSAVQGEPAPHPQPRSQEPPLAPRGMPRGGGTHGTATSASTSMAPSPPHDGSPSPPIELRGPRGKQASERGEDDLTQGSPGMSRSPLFSASSSPATWVPHGTWTRVSESRGRHRDTGPVTPSPTRNPAIAPRT